MLWESREIVAREEDDGGRKRKNKKKKYRICYVRIAPPLRW
jgi:hypothetical protein